MGAFKDRAIAERAAEEESDQAINDLRHRLTHPEQVVLAIDGTISLADGEQVFFHIGPDLSWTEWGTGDDGIPLHPNVRDSLTQVVRDNSKRTETFA